MRLAWAFVEEYYSDVVANLLLIVFAICCVRLNTCPYFSFSREMILTVFIGSMLIYPLDRIYIATVYTRSAGQIPRARCIQRLRTILVSIYEYAPSALLLAFLGSLFIVGPLPCWLNVLVIWGLVYLLLFAIFSPRR